MAETAMTFQDLGLSEAMRKALEKKGYGYPTSVQREAIPPLLAWKDVIAKAPTGTGKTFAFGIPMIEHVNPESSDVQGLILAPTRELAIQICDELRSLLAFYTGIRVTVLYGGASLVTQAKALEKKPQIVVATPGRLMDHYNRKNIRFDKVQTIILDEADRMLDMGFFKDVTHILDKLKNKKMMGLFSATISREVMDISWVYQRDPVEITVRADEQNKPDIIQYRIDVARDAKVDTMLRILNKEGYERVVVFCNTKGMVERATKFLQIGGVEAECIHGDIPQVKREKVMQRFRDGKLRVFVATDVAARGIDVDDVDAVFNYDVPEENEYYIHRIGRTGRAKRHGVAYTFVSDYGAMVRLDEIAKFTRNAITAVSVDMEGNLLPVKKG